MKAARSPVPTASPFPPCLKNGTLFTNIEFKKLSTYYENFLLCLYLVQTTETKMKTKQPALSATPQCARGYQMSPLTPSVLKSDNSRFSL